MLNFIFGRLTHAKNEFAEYFMWLFWLYKVIKMYFSKKMLISFSFNVKLLNTTWLDKPIKKCICKYIIKFALKFSINFSMSKFGWFPWFPQKHVCKYIKISNWSQAHIIFSMARGFSMRSIQFGLMELDSQKRAKKSN